MPPTTNNNSQLSRTSSFSSTASSSPRNPNICTCRKYPTSPTHATESTLLETTILAEAPLHFPLTVARGFTFKITGVDALKRSTNRVTGETRSWVLYYRELIEWPGDGSSEGQRKLVKGEWANSPDLSLGSLVAAMGELESGPYEGAVPVRPERLEAFGRNCSMCGLMRDARGR